MTGTLALLERFCGALYAARDVEAALQCLDDGALVTGFHGRARGRAETAGIIYLEIGVLPAPCALCFSDETEECVAEGVTEVSLSVAATGDGAFSRRFSGVAVTREGITKFITLRFELPRDTDAQSQSERLSDLVRNISCGIAVCLIDREDHLSIQYLNEGYFAVMEEARDRLSARYDADIVSGIHIDDREMVQAHLDDLMRTRRGHEMTYRYVTSRGKIKWIHVETRAVSHADGTTTSYSTYTDLTERMALEKKLTAMTETVPCGVCLYMRAGDVLTPLMYNRRFCDMLGNHAVEPLALSSGTESKCPFAEDREAFEEAAAKVLAGETQVIFEARVAGKSGRVHWLRVRLTALAPSGAGEEMTLCAVERIGVEKELRRRYEMERQRPRLGENSLLAYALINLSADETLEYVYWDGTPVPLEDRLSLSDGFRNAEALLIDAEERKRFIALHDVRVLLDAFSRGETEFSIDCRRRLPSGDIIWVRNILRLLRTPDSSDVLLFEYRYDIDDEKTTAITHQRLTNRAYDFIARVCLDTRRYLIRFRSPNEQSAPPQRGEDAEAVFLRLIDEHVDLKDRETVRRYAMCESVREALKKSDSLEFSCRTAGVDGTVKEKRVSIFYLDAQRELVIVTCEDVTALMREETQKNELLTGALETARQASHAKTQFLSRMSHELRTPMNAVIGLSALIAEDPGNAAAVADAAKKIGASGQYLLSLINDILEMTRIESGRLTLREEPFDLNSLLTDVHGVVCARIVGKSIDYRVESVGSIEKQYIGDKEKIRQILVHILGNAVKFTPAGGRINLTVAQCRRSGDHAELRLTVDDTGVGIDAAFLPRIFEPFAQETVCFTPGEAGTGLGLTIARHLANMMNGEIAVRSVKGQGTSVTITLALGVPRLPARDANRLINLTGRRILIAEDHPINAEVVRRLMQKTGAETVVAVNGKDAVERFAQSEPFYFDAVLMDIQMPVMDGLNAAKNIRALKRPDSARVPIIALTANTFAEDRERSLAYGMDAHIGKPIDPAAMFGTLNDLMRPREGS